LVVLSWGGLLLGGALFLLAVVLVALDGQLARLKKEGSVVGMHFVFFFDEF
jgi:phosphatidylglycerophosphate synthase